MHFGLAFLSHFSIPFERDPRPENDLEQRQSQQKEMDLTSLLNTSAGASLQEHQDVPQQSQESSSSTQSVSTSWAGLPTPSPEKSPPRSAHDYRPSLKSRTPWDAGGYSLPLSLDTKFFPTSQKPTIYNDSLDSHSLSALSAITPSSGHSRTTSLESSPADMVSSALVSPMTSSQHFKYV